MPVRIQSRPQGIRPWDARLPKGLDGRIVVAILTGSNHQVASRIWLDAGRELALRVIFDTGSGVSLVREVLLPPEMKVAPLDAATAQLFDVNGGLFPIAGTVTHTVNRHLLHTRHVWSSARHGGPSTPGNRLNRRSCPQHLWA